MVHKAHEVVRRNCVVLVILYYGKMYEFFGNLFTSGSLTPVYFQKKYEFKIFIIERKTFKNYRFSSSDMIHVSTFLNHSLVHGVHSPTSSENNFSPNVPTGQGVGTPNCAVQ